MFYYSEQDNLGNHTATQNLDVASNRLVNVSGVSLNNSWEVNQTSTTLSVKNSTDKFVVNSNGRVTLVAQPPLDAASNHVLVWNSGTGDISYRTASSLGGSGGGVGASGTLELVKTGTGTHADPVTACDLVFTNTSGSVSIDYSTPVYWCQGQAGGLVADGTMAYQPRFIVPSGYQINICQVMVSLGRAGTTQTDLQISILNDVGGTAPTPGSPTSTLSLGSGVTNTLWTALHGTTLNSMQHLQSRIDVAGTSAENLTIHFWGKTCVCA